MKKAVKRAAILLAAAWSLAAAADDAPPASARVLVFQVLLDDKPIGRHRFEIAGDPGARRVASDAEFSVKMLGLQVYRYRHHAEERWSGDCLAALDATTDDDGKATAVHLERQGEAQDLRVGDAHRRVDGCLLSYAYWNPAALRGQTRLLNPQTGRIDAVRVERAGDGTIPVGGRPVAAERWRITGPEAPVDVWVSAQGEWIGLDSTVRGGSRRLSYRLP
jgi:hypothetical protein